LCKEPATVRPILALNQQATTGVSHPASAKKYRAPNDRVAKAVAACGRAEVRPIKRRFIVARLSVAVVNICSG